MSFTGLLIAIVSAVVLAALIFDPLMRSSETGNAVSVEADAIQRQRESLRLAYDAVLQTLRDLEEDHTLGKLSDSEYEAEKKRWNIEGVRLLRERDEARHAAAKLRKTQGL